MAKKFFTNVSPKAVEGIRRAYAGTGAEIHAKVAPDGNATVVVILPNGMQLPRGKFGLKSKESKDIHAAA